MDISEIFGTYPAILISYSSVRWNTYSLLFSLFHYSKYKDFNTVFNSFASVINIKEQKTQIKFVSPLKELIQEKSSYYIILLNYFSQNLIKYYCLNCNHLFYFEGWKSQLDGFSLIQF